MKRKLLIAVGFISFALGAIGAVLPILPTTPFLLLSGYCFVRSSEKFNHWLKQTRLYEEYVSDFAETRTIPREKKWKILMNIYVLMGISIFFASIPWVRLMWVGITIFQTIMLMFFVPDGEEQEEMN